MSATLRPFRFGALPGDTPPEAWAERAKRVEDMGYSTLLLPDHFVTDFAPIPALAAAAAATSTLRVGAMVFDNDFRHPAVLAKDIATLDVMTSGRVEAGIGAGWHRPEYEAAGIPFDAPGTRVARLIESIAVLKGLWRSEPFSFDGEHYHITDMTGLPQPHQRPHPPLMIGGGGRRLLELAGREADIVSFAGHITPAGIDPHSLTAEGVAERIAWVRASAGDRDVELSCYYSTPAILSADTDAALTTILERLRERWGESPLTESDIASSPHYLVGDAKEMADRLVERRERFGLSYVVFTDEVEQYADVVTALAGT